MKWGNPTILYGLWLIIPLAFLLLYLARRRLRTLNKLAADSVLPLLIPGWEPKRYRLKNNIWLLGITLGVLALSRPQWGFHWEEVKRRGLDVLIVLDTSRSMMAEDIKPNRLQQAKWGIRDVVSTLKGDRIGLVAFSGGSFLQCPLTIDYAAFLMTLDDVYCGIIPRGGTAIEQALKTAMEGFEKSTEADRAIILITDGEDHEGNPMNLVKELKEKNIRVYAIGIGTGEGELIPVADESGRASFLKDRSGNVVKSSLHEDSLETLALATEGAYVRSAPGDIGLERVFQEGLANLKRTEEDSKMIKAYDDRFSWILGGALICFIVEALATEKRKTAASRP